MQFVVVGATTKHSSLTTRFVRVPSLCTGQVVLRLAVLLLEVINLLAHAGVIAMLYTSSLQALHYDVQQRLLRVAIAPVTAAPRAVVGRVGEPVQHHPKRRLAAADTVRVPEDRALLARPRRSAGLLAACRLSRPR